MIELVCPVCGNSIKVIACVMTYKGEPVASCSHGDNDSRKPAWMVEANA